MFKYVWPLSRYQALKSLLWRHSLQHSANLYGVLIYNLELAFSCWFWFLTLIILDNIFQRTKVNGFTKYSTKIRRTFLQILSEICCRLFSSHWRVGSSRLKKEKESIYIQIVFWVKFPFVSVVSKISNFSFYVRMILIN